MSEEKSIDQMSTEEAQNAINEMYAPDHPYLNPRDPRYRGAVDRMNKLNEKLYPATGDGGYDALAEKLEAAGIKSAEDIEKLAAEKKTGNDEDELELTPEEKQGLDNLKKEWGADYDQNLELASTAVDVGVKLVGDDVGKGFIDALEESGMGNDVRVIRFFHAFARKIEEEGGN